MTDDQIHTKEPVNTLEEEEAKETHVSKDLFRKKT